MRPFEHIQLQLAYRDKMKKTVQDYTHWKLVVMPDGTKLYFSRALMEHENRQSRGI